MPKVTVLMPVYNGATYVREAVQSILAQSFRDFELLIVEDGSTDDTASILSTFNDSRIKVIRHAQNVGVTRSLNHGLAEARGELVARQDADDLSEPGRLASQVAYLDQHPTVALVGTQARYLVNGAAPMISRSAWRATTPATVRFQCLFGNPFIHTSVMFRRRTVWCELGGYDESYRGSQDLRLWSRLLERHDAVSLPEYLVNHRLHGASISRTYTAEDRGPMEPVLRRALSTCYLIDSDLREWPSLWSRVLNGQIVDGPTLVRIASMARLCLRRFLEVWGRANQAEARQICAGYFLLLASRHLRMVPANALLLLWEACKVSSAFSVRELVIWVVRQLRSPQVIR